MLRAFSGWPPDLWLSPETSFRNTFQPACPHTLNVGPIAPAAFPLGTAAGAGFAVPNHRQARPPVALASGVIGQSPRHHRRPRPRISISTSPTESLTWSLTAFTHTRARLPHSPGERPRTSPCETPTTGPRTPSLTMFKTVTAQASTSARGNRTSERRKWTSPYGYRAWAASACRSRISGSH